MYQNMRVPVITGDFITNPSICTVSEIKKDGEVVAPVYIDSKTDDVKYGVLIEYGNYLYIENKSDSIYDIQISFEVVDKIVMIVKPGSNYSIKIVTTTFLSLKNVATNETVLFTL